MAGPRPLQRRRLLQTRVKVPDHQHHGAAEGASLPHPRQNLDAVLLDLLPLAPPVPSLPPRQVRVDPRGETCKVWRNLVPGHNPTGLAVDAEQGRVYVVTSVLETFGLTALEAMGAGVPVVASDATCLPEVCGDAAVYCNPRDPDDIAQKIHRVASDVDMQRELQQRGLERVKHFSWERSASEYLGALEAAIGISASAREAGVPAVGAG